MTLRDWAVASQAIHGPHGNTCDCCGKAFAIGERVYRDHDHQTGQARGLLCYQCNRFTAGSADLERLFDVLIYFCRVRVFYLRQATLGASQ